MSWGIVAGTVVSVASGAASASAAGSAADKAAKGSAKELAYNKEGRDLAREDQAPYREAGATALDALMSMTGLGVTGFGKKERQRETDVNRVTGQDYLGNLRGVLGKKGRKQLDRYLGSTNYEGGVTDDQAYISNFTSQLKKKGVGRAERFEAANPYGRAVGGNISGMAGPNRFENRSSPVEYNINEAGPENVYSGGVMSRTPNPTTIEASQDGYVQPNENPGGMEGGYNFQTDPGYEFRKAEGERGLDRSAAARGGVISGGHSKDLIRFGQDYASNEYSNVYNRIAGIAGIGPAAAGASGGYAVQGGQSMGRAASEGANSSAYGDIAASNAWANAGNEIAGMDWNGVFNRNSGGVSGGDQMATMDPSAWSPKQRAI